MRMGADGRKMPLKLQKTENMRLYTYAFLLRRGKIVGIFALFGTREQKRRENGKIGFFFEKYVSENFFVKELNKIFL